MAGRLRGAIALVAVAGCALGCVNWRATSARATERSRTPGTRSKPLASLQVTGDVAAAGELLLEVRRMCSADEIVVVRHAVTESASVGRGAAYLAVGGFLLGAVGIGLGLAADSPGGAIAAAVGGGAMMIPLVVSVGKRGKTRSREFETTETRPIETACEHDGFSAGTEVAVTTPWATELKAPLTADGMIVLRPTWDRARLQAGALWQVRAQDLMVEWKPGETTLANMRSAAGKQSATKKPRAKKPAANKRPRAKKP